MNHLENYDAETLRELLFLASMDDQHPLARHIQELQDLIRQKEQENPDQK